MSESEQEVFKQGDIIPVVIREVPPPDSLLENGKPKLPVGINGKFVVIIEGERIAGLAVGQTVNVTLLKVLKSHRHNQMAFGAVAL